MRIYLVFEIIDGKFTFLERFWRIDEAREFMSSRPCSFMIVGEESY